mgnify:CR=1 FL=1
MLQYGYENMEVAGMNIRRAKEKDVERLMELLGQVLQIHADIRPDIFIPGTTKYTKDELALNKAANCPGKTSVIRIPRIIKPIVKIIPYCIPS